MFHVLDALNWTGGFLIRPYLHNTSTVSQ